MIIWDSLECKPCNSTQKSWWHVSLMVFLFSMGKSGKSIICRVSAHHDGLFFGGFFKKDD